MSYKRTISIGGLLVLIVLLVSGFTFYMSSGCPRGTFSCDNGTVCVPQRQVCDNHTDCTSGEDEDLIECGMFYGSKKLISTIMKNVHSKEDRKHHQHNGTSSKNDEFRCDIQTYPTSCSCKYSTMLYCGEDTGLTAIPEISSEVTQLLIIGNNITLTKDAFQGLNPIYLNLKHNNISELPDGIFDSLGRLQKLYLNYNHLDELPRNVFKKLKSLRWLFLNSNKLHKFPLITLKDLGKLEWMNLSDNSLTLKDEIFPRMDILIEMSLDYNQLDDIDEKLFSQLNSLYFLSITYNKIKYIHPRAFWGLTNLRELRLTGNPIKQLFDDTFAELSQLDALYIGYTDLTLDRQMVLDLNISYLNLEGIDFKQIDFEAIRELSRLQYIVYDKFYFCSMTPQVKKCKPNTDGISSFGDLLTKPVLRYSTWSMGCITFLGNMLVLWGRFIYTDENQGVTMVIRNLAVSDMLMGLYLFVIGIQDIRYRNRYHEVALDWMSSWGCAAAGVLAVTSSEVSMLILGFMSLERFLLIAAPFGGHRRLNSGNICICLLVIWILGTMTAITPVILWRSSTRFYGRYSGTCFPLHIQERYPLGWEYSAFLFLGLNLFLLVMIAMLYTALIVSIWRTRKATPLAVLDCEFAIKFFFIVLTDITCWAPIIFMKIYAFFSYDISDDIFAWLVVFILPLNSAVNPLLYTFTTPKYRNQVLLRGWHKFTSKRSKMEGSGNSNVGSESQGKILPLLYPANNTVVEFQDD